MHCLRDGDALVPGRARGLYSALCFCARSLVVSAGVLFLQGCRTSTSPSAQLLRLDLTLDSTSFRYGEPIGWRQELVNVSGDSLGFPAGTFANEFSYRLVGPAGEVSRRIMFLDMVGSLVWLQAGGANTQLGHPYNHFVMESQPGTPILPSLDPGWYELQVTFASDGYRNGSLILLSASAVNTFEVVAPETSYRETVDAAVGSFLRADSARSRGTIGLDSLAALLEALRIQSSDPVWFGLLLWNARIRMAAGGAGQVRALDSLLQETTEAHVRARLRRAFHSRLIGSLDSIRRQALCESLSASDPGERNARIACSPY